MAILSQLSSVQTIREAHLQIGSTVWTAAHREADGHPAGRRRGVQDQPLTEGRGSQILSLKEANEYEAEGGKEKIFVISTITAKSLGRFTLTKALL